MADDLFDPEVFEELLAYSRRSPVNFGFAIGKKVDESVLVFHKRKPGEELARKAKKLDNVSSKTACGTASTKGKLITLDCEEYVPGMKKALKQTFKKQGMQLKVNIVPPQGVELDPEDAEQDVDDEAPVDVATDELESEQQEEETEETAEDRIAQLTQELKQLVPQVTQAGTADPGRRDELVTLVREATANIKAGQADMAEGNLERLREMLAQTGSGSVPPPPPPPPSDSPLKQQLMQALPKVTPAVARVLNSPDVDDQIKQQLRGMVDQLKTGMKEGRYDDAKALLAQIVAEVKQQAPPEAPRGEGPQVTYAKARLRWDDATKRIHADLTTLRGPFVEEFPEDEELLERAKQEIDGKLNEFRESLADTLDDALNSQTPEDRQRHHERAIGEIGRFRQSVFADGLIDLIDSESDGLASLRSALTSALDDIETHISG